MISVSPAFLSDIFFLFHIFPPFIMSPSIRCISFLFFPLSSSFLAGVSFPLFFLLFSFYLFLLLVMSVFPPFSLYLFLRWLDLISCVYLYIIISVSTHLSKEIISAFHISLSLYFSSFTLPLSFSHSLCFYRRVRFLPRTRDSFPFFFFFFYLLGFSFSLPKIHTTAVCIYRVWRQRLYHLK